MYVINEGMVFSNDIETIMRGNNPMDFRYQDKDMVLPKTSFYNDLRKDFEKDIKKIFGTNYKIIGETEMYNAIYLALVDVYKKILIVSLDKIYVKDDNDNIFFLDCTRLDGSKELVSRNNPSDMDSVSNQVKYLSNLFISNGYNEIILTDDVVFSGTVLNTLIQKFKENGINVVGVRSAVSTMSSYKLFNEKLPLGLKCGYLLSDNMIDQICERDFYFGVAGSGISIKKDGNVYKAPYFNPFGNPVERASIPKSWSKYFSNSCIDRSIYLWEEIEKLSNRKILCSELPEEIDGVNKSEEVVLTLKKGRR